MKMENRNRIHMGVFIFISAVLLWVAASRTVAADAAYTTDGTYYPDILASEKNTFGDYVDSAFDTCEYFFVTKSNDTVYLLCFIDDSVIDNIGCLYTDSSGSLGFYYSYVFTVTYNRIRDKWVVSSVIVLNPDIRNLVSIGSKDSGFNLVGTNFPLYQNYLQDTGGVELPQNNLFFPGSGGGNVPTTSVTLSVNGTVYTVEEPYPYYFVSYAYDSVRLFFTEEPFTAYWTDLYTFNLSPGMQPVVCYYWSEGENNDFLSSRAIDALGLSYKHPASADYSSNYDVLSSKDSGRVFLPEKLLYPDVSTLYSAFTDEMLGYKHCIILRQEHEDALTNDVVCYLWNDSAANLIIRWGDSCIAAARKGTPVTDYLAARYDLRTGTWNIDKNTPISRCNNEVYNIPYIYYSTSDLYVQQPGQTGWYPSDMCVSAGSLEVPGFHPGIPTEPGFSTGVDWLDTLLDNLFDGLGKFFSRIFVPSSGYFERKVDALKQKFCFWESIVSTVEVFLNFFENTDFSEPPRITVNLSSATSKYDYGTSATFLDLSWYEPYKPSVDMLLSSIMWVVFAWNTFKNLPSIISGVATAVNVDAQVRAASTLKIENSELKRSRERSGRWSR